MAVPDGLCPPCNASGMASRAQVPPPCDLTLGLECLDKSTPGRTVWAMKAEERFSNPVGIMQGGFLAALCDSAMGASAITWAMGQGRRLRSAANTDLRVSFLGAVRTGSRLTCTAVVVSGGSRVAFVEAEVVDDAGRAVGRASSTYLLTDV